MNQVIRDRRPTDAETDEYGKVLWWCESTKRWSAADHRIIREGDIWKPIDQTPPPRLEKAKRRRRGTQVCYPVTPERDYYALEVRPDDPPDLDEFIEAAINLARSFTKPNVDAVLRARQGEGGDA